MQHSADTPSPYYQYPHPLFHSRHLSDPMLNPNPASSAGATSLASAPPLSTSYSSSDYFNYSSAPPSYLQNSDYAPNLPPNAPNFPSSAPSQLPYSFPHLWEQPQPSYGYDQNQNSSSYGHAGISNYNPIANSSYPLNSYSSPAFDASSFPNHGDPYDNGQDIGGYVPQGTFGGPGDNYAANGIYKYSGGKTESFADRGGFSQSSSEVIFDDYGRPIDIPNGKVQNGSASDSRVTKAIPKADAHEDVKNSGVQKFRVNLLSEGYGQNDMDVLCQIGLDGIRILDPSTSRILKIYSLENVTRCEVLDSYIFAFWTKSSVDVEPKRIRLKTNSYTSNNILDIVTAAMIQVKEIGENNDSYDPHKGTEQHPEKKKGFGDWMNLMRPKNEEKEHWVPDEAVAKCTACRVDFGTFNRRHHCRNCGDIFCDKCTQGRITLTTDENDQPVRVCDPCMAEVTQRLTNSNEANGKVRGLQSHEDLAKKLQDVMNKNRTTSRGSKSDDSSLRVKEVECPTCTVHLQFQVPATGSETIECSVCQHPFIVNAR